jgi:hypothetical protein
LNTVPPAVSTINVISSTEIDVLFNEPLDTSTANIELNYSADNSLEILQQQFPTEAILHWYTSHFLRPFTNGLLNTLTVTTVADPAGQCHRVIIRQLYVYSRCYTCFPAM